MALTSNIGSNLQVKFGHIQAYTAGGAIWRGGTIVLNLVDGKAYAAVDVADSETEKYLVVGFAMEAAVEDATVRVRSDGKLKRKWYGSDAGKKCGLLACVKDDETVQAASAGRIIAGRITEVGAQYVFVDFEAKLARLATNAID